MLLLHDTPLDVYSRNGERILIDNLIALEDKNLYCEGVSLADSLDTIIKKIKGTDLIIIGSTSRFPFEKELLEFILNHTIQFIKIELDYNFCVRRTVACLHNPAIRTCCNPEKYHLYSALFAKARLLYFLSEEQQSLHYSFYGEAVSKYKILYPKFLKTERKESDTNQDVIFTHDIVPVYGGDKLIEYAYFFPEKNIHVYGLNHHSFLLPKNITIHEEATYDEIIAHIEASSYFFYSPEFFEVSNLFFLHAYFCHKQIITYQPERLQKIVATYD